MTEKDLSKYYWLKKEAADLADRIEEFGDGVKSMQLKEVSVSSSHSNVSLQEKKMELINLLIEKRLSALEKYLEIERFINSVPDAELRMIMRLRTLDLKTWNQVADELSSGDIIFSEDAVKKRYYRYFKKNK